MKNQTHLDSYVILDAKAVMHHCYNIGKDPDAILTDLGNEINTLNFAFMQFLERYMIPILEFVRPYQILIAHDAGTHYRSTIFPEYKQQKSRTDKDPEQRVVEDEFLTAMKQFWAAIGCTQARVEGVEADDIIAYFVERLPGQKIVYTTDADLLVLASDTCQVALKCEPQTEGSHKGIPYHLTSIAKSMLGDKSDNYGGVYGFGDAKFQQLLTDFGEDGIQELEECVKTRNYSLIKEVLADGPHKALQLLIDNIPQWELGYDLAKLHPELCWKPKGKKLTKIDWYRRVPLARNIRAVMERTGSLYYFDKFKDFGATEWAVTAENIDDDFYSEFEAACEESDIVSFDYETYPSEQAMRTNPKGEDYVDVMEALIAGVSFNFGNNLQNTIYIPVNHLSADNVPKKVIRRMLEIAEAKSNLVAQNTAFEVTVTKTNLDLWLGPVFDTALMRSYVDENEPAGLKKMSKDLLNYQQSSYLDTVTDTDGNVRTMDQLTLEEVLSYGCDDSLVTSHLFVLMRIIMLLEGSNDFFEEYETCAIHSLSDAYLTGCEIDWGALAEQSSKDHTNIEEKTKRLRQLLEENCKEPNVKAATAYAEEEKKYTRLLAKEKIKDKLKKQGANLTSEEAMATIADTMQSAYADFLSDCVDASVYKPYTEEYEAVEFKPTVTQLNEVISNLGFEALLEKVTKTAISDWLVEANDFDIEKGSAESTKTPAQKRFIRLLGEAAHQLSKREGEEYDAFIKFCSEHSKVTGKLITSGDELNVGSPKQMAQILYCKLGLPVRLKNLAIKSKVRTRLGVDGSPQTDALAIETAMAEDTVEGDWRREAMQCIQSIKSSQTRISLYHAPYPLWKHVRDGRIHPQVRDCGTVTRRPSGTSPNILQVSKHQEGGVMRSVYLPYAENELIVSIDFSQQELRIMASECGDRNLIACYVGANLRDVHSSTAAGIAKVSYEDYIAVYNDPSHPLSGKYQKIRKRPAKATNFLVAYVGQADTLSRRLIIPYEEAKDMMDSAYATYPDIQPWQADVAKFARRHGYSQTAYGNRRHVSSDILSDEKSKRSRMERQAINYTIQGCAADILKIVLTECWRTGLWRDTGATLLGPVYDEITSSVPASQVVSYVNRLVEIMSITPPGHVVPMEADVSLGPNWRDQIEIGIRPTVDAIESAVAQSLEMKHAA